MATNNYILDMRIPMISHNDPSAMHTEYKQNTNILAICAAAVRITKGLLGYGAENNLTDVCNSDGRAYSAGFYRKNWLYISAKDRLNPDNDSMIDDECKETNKTLANKSQNKNYFFYSPNFETADAKSNFLARKAAAAVLAHTGACDQHAYVLTMLLRHLLPIGTSINICAFKNNRSDEDFLHTFVVVGHVTTEEPDLTSRERIKYQTNDKQFAVDAWPVLGGVVKLHDFWVRQQSHNDKSERSLLSLHIDHKFLADGKDHLIKRVLKQRALLAAAGIEKPNITINQSGYGFYSNDLTIQKNIVQHVKPVNFMNEKITGMWNAPSVTCSDYQEPQGTISTLHQILKQNSALKDLLIWVDEELGDDVSPRIGSGVAPLS
jgi:hypothetical protein